MARITYREAAALAGLPYNEHISGDTFLAHYGEWPPHLGSSAAMVEAFVQDVVQVLGPGTETYFHGSVEQGNYHWGDDDFPVDWLERGEAADLVAVYRREGQLPTYTFAADHAWCLFQGEWVNWLAVGC
ncbi:hypothetical protein [Hymenobacter latericus]|uniref:hypothetical protein n=1 Tax=Hymenobacter sp. YIM 151858-1 TaxID=2987688 RepID=UPI002227F1BE|nr:hypothetical protein [Hymenobacter sp. YIM 151858-1]UYZ61235.1 hypothetical protein OIS50_19895 [Hymenobacter sp. YIM 151858-1]